MPHRAGYFVLAYCWDHHCQELVQSLEEKLRHVERELGELTAASAASLFDLLNYYKKWHYNNDLYHAVDAEIERREFVIRSHGYRGYGVNRDLTGALQTLSSRYNHLGQKLEEAFTRNVEAVKTTIYLPRELVDLRRSDYIITELCNKLSIVEGGQVPWAVHPVRLDLDRYFSVMRHETREEAAVVEMRVREEHVVDAVGGDVERRPVPELRVALLGEPAIDEEGRPLPLDQVSGACDAPRRAEKCQTDRTLSCHGVIQPSLPPAGTDSWYRNRRT